MQDFLVKSCAVCQKLCRSSHLITRNDECITDFLQKNGICETTPVTLCRKCNNSMNKRGDIPANSWIFLAPGYIPHQLKNLNFIEKRLISLVQPYISVMTLPLGQKALKGQVIHFPSPSLQVTRSVPNLSCDTVIVHQESLTKTAITHYASRNKVNDAIVYLKTHNHLYSGISICDKNLHLLTGNETDIISCEHFTTMPSDYTSTCSVQNFIGTVPEFSFPRSTDVPINMFEDNNLEAKIFPWLFPRGTATFVQQKNLSFKSYCQSRMLHKSLFFAKACIHILAFQSAPTLGFTKCSQTCCSKEQP